MTSDEFIESVEFGDRWHLVTYSYLMTSVKFSGENLLCRLSLGCHMLLTGYRKVTLVNFLCHMVAGSRVVRRMDEGKMPDDLLTRSLICINQSFTFFLTKRFIRCALSQSPVKSHSRLPK